MCAFYLAQNVQSYIFHFPLGFTCVNFCSILLEGGGEEVVMVIFNTKMRGQDQTRGKVNLPDITEEEAPLIKVHTNLSIFITIIVIIDERKAHEKRANALLEPQK